MSKICKTLKEKGYYRVNEHYYTKTREDKSNWDYFFKWNDLIFSKKIHIDPDLYHARCNDAYLPPTMYDYLNFVPDDQLIICYSDEFKLYLIFAFYAVGVSGTSEYVIVKDDECYDYKNINDWNALNIPDESINAFLELASKNINFLTNRNCVLSAGNDPKQTYNEDLLVKFADELKLFKEEFDELLIANKCATYENNIHENIMNAFKTDDYQLLMKNISAEEYYAGKPLLIYAIDLDAKNIFNKLIENKRILDYYDLSYRGCAVNYAVTHKSENRMHFIESLVKSECDINSRDVFGRNILYDAIETLDDDVFDYVFNLEGLEIDSIPRKKRLFTIEPQTEYNEETSLIPALHYACIKGYYHAVQSIAPKVDIDASNEDVGTALYYAIAVNQKTEEQYKIIEYLLKCGANQNWYIEEEWPRSGKKGIKQLIENSTDERLLKLLDKYKKEGNNE